MKKLFILLSAFIICGCSNEIKPNISDVSEILYEDTNMAINDFNEIVYNLNDKIFYPLYNFKSEGTTLSIITNEQTYNFQILDNYVIYIKDSKYYTKYENIKKDIESIKEKYKSTDLIDITTKKNYDTNKSDYIFKLDDSKNYIIITTKMNLYNFRIERNYVSNLESQISKVDNGKTLCIEIENLNDLNISFTNPYNNNFIVTYEDGFNIKLKDA